MAARLTWNIGELIQFQKECYSYLVEVIVPLHGMIIISCEWGLEIVCHVTRDGDAEHKSDAHPEWSIQIRSGSDVVLEKWFARHGNHGVQHSVLHINRVNIKELLVECEGPEVGCFPVWRSSVVIIINQLTGVSLSGGGGEGGETWCLLLCSSLTSKIFNYFVFKQGSCFCKSHQRFM